MKVYLDCPPRLGQGIHRVVRELVAHLPPGVEATSDRTQAEFILHHVVGVQNFSDVPIDQLIQQDGKPYGIIQYCLKTTEQPSTAWWDRMVWGGARVVWSYYDLPQLMRDERYWQPGEQWPAFYHAPLGVSDAFQQQSLKDQRPAFLVGTSGYVAESEYVDVWAEVANQFNWYFAHLGPPLPCLDQYGTAHQRLTDEELARLWAQCHFVNGLRAVEGFELPAAEGLVCGARPVLFDRPEHRQWFGEHACYIPEGPREEIRDDLEILVGRYHHLRVTDDERAWARDQFNWPRILRGLWRTIGYDTPESPR